MALFKSVYRNPWSTVVPQLTWSFYFFAYTLSLKKSSVIDSAFECVWSEMAKYAKAFVCLWSTLLYLLYIKIILLVLK